MKLIGSLLPPLLLCLIPSMEGEVINNNNPPFGPCVDFFLNKQPILPPGMVSPRYKQICQVHANQYRYATLYDTDLRIPVYSAYYFTGFIPNLTRKTSWWIEPQLDVKDCGNAAMNTEASTNQKTVYDQNPGIVGFYQALNEDYTVQNNPLGYQKGHLYPHCENCDQIQAASTFTLTNAAPQAPKDNKQWFHQVENILRNGASARCAINVQQKLVVYVVTGVVPSCHNHNLANRVNIPSHYWTAFCCVDKTNQNSFISEGYVMQMTGNGNGQLHIYGSAQKPFAQLNHDLSKAYGLPDHTFQVFGKMKGCS